MTAGCAKCSFKIEGVSGADVNAHESGLRPASKEAELAGKVDGDNFVAESFTLKD